MKAEITVNQKIKKSTIKLQSHIDTALFRAFLWTITEFSLEEFKNAALLLRLGLSSTLAFHENGAFRPEEFWNYKVITPKKDLFDEFEWLFSLQISQRISFRCRIHNLLQF